jgi:hypothetical protein
MGVSKSKTKTTTGPSAYAKPYIDAAGGALGSAYAQTQPLASSISNTIGAQLPGLADKAFTPDPGVTAATGYNTDVLSGKYLGEGNPYLSGIANDTENDVRDRVAAQFSMAGRTGGGANQLALTKGLATTRNNLYGAQYDAERTRMAQAAALAPTLAQGQYTGLGAYLTAAQAATGIPQQAAGAYAGGLGSLFGGYGTQTGTQSQGLGSILGSVAGSGLAGWASGGFKGF